MRSASKVVFALVLAAGPLAGVVTAIAGPALAQGVLPDPQVTIPGVPVPSGNPTPLPRPPAPHPLPTRAPVLPGVPRAPGVPVPALPGLPGLPGLPAVPGTAAKPAAPPAAPSAVQDYGFLPFGHYVDDGLGRWVPPPVVIPVPHYTLPPEQPYDDSGSNTYRGRALDTNGDLIAQASSVRRSTAGEIAHALASHALLDVLAVLTVAGAAAGVTAARRRGLV